MPKPLQLITSRQHIGTHFTYNKCQQICAFAGLKEVFRSSAQKKHQSQCDFIEGRSLEVEAEVEDTGQHVVVEGGEVLKRVHHRPDEVIVPLDLGQDLGPRNGKKDNHNQ